VVCKGAIAKRRCWFNLNWTKSWVALTTGDRKGVGKGGGEGKGGGGWVGKEGDERKNTSRWGQNLKIPQEKRTHGGG